MQTLAPQMFKGIDTPTAAPLRAKCQSMLAHLPAVKREHGLVKSCDAQVAVFGQAISQHVVVHIEADFPTPQFPTTTCSRSLFSRAWTRSDLREGSQLRSERLRHGGGHLGD